MSKELIHKTNKLLEEICKRLYKDHFFAFGGSLNYTVSVKIFSGNSLANSDEIDLIETILNTNTEVSNIEESNLFELLETVKEYFEFSGDEGSYPNQKYLSSNDFRNELNELLKQLKVLFSESSGILKFWLKEGHPFYPVYWDYAFLIKKSDDNYILIGSSSD
jgi:hypothetical protein